MEMVMGWLSKVDWMTVGAAAGTFILGIGIIKSKLGKAVGVIGELADLLSEIKKGLADGKLEKTELEAIVVQADELLKEWKK